MRHAGKEAISECLPRFAFLLTALGFLLASCRLPEEPLDRSRQVFDLYQLDVKSGLTTPLTNDHTTYFWAAQTRSGAMVSVMINDQGRQGLYVREPGATGTKRLLHEASVFIADPFLDHSRNHQKILLTPDEQKIIYCDADAINFASYYGRYSKAIRMVNLDGSGFEELAIASDETAIGGIALSPDGTHIIYDERNFSTNSTDIVSLNLQSKEKTVIRHFDSSIVVAPQYVPNTGDIVFYQHRWAGEGKDTLKLIHANDPSFVKAFTAASVIDATNFPVVAENGLMTNINSDGYFELVNLSTSQKIPLHISATERSSIGLTRNGQKAVVATGTGLACQIIIFNTSPLATSATFNYSSEQFQRIKLLQISEDGNTVLFIGEYTYAP